MTFEQFKKNVESKLKKKGERESCFCTLSLSTTEWLLFHEVSLKESVEMNGNLFQPYRTVMDVRVPSFILVCKDASRSPTAAVFKKRGYPVMDAATLRLPSKKETEAFVFAFIEAHLNHRPFN
jgi:hypothetical protein